MFFYHAALANGQRFLLTQQSGLAWHGNCSQQVKIASQQPLRQKNAADAMTLRQVSSSQKCANSHYGFTRSNISRFPPVSWRCDALDLLAATNQIAPNSSLKFEEMDGMASASSAQNMTQSKRIINTIFYSARFFDSRLNRLNGRQHPSCSDRGIWRNKASELLSLQSSANTQTIITEIQAGESFLASQSANPIILSSLKGEDSPGQSTNSQNELNELLGSGTAFKEIFVVNQAGTVLLSSQAKWLNVQLPDEWLNHLSPSKTTFTGSTSISNLQELLQDDPLLVLSTVPITVYIIHA